MSRPGARVLATLALTCGTACALPLGARAQMATAAGGEERGAFVLLRGADTLAVERFRRTPLVLEATLVERVTGLRIAYRVETTPAAATSLVTVRAWRAAAPDTAAPLQQGALTFANDSVVLTEARLAAPIRVAAPAGTVWFLNMAGSSFEQIVRRARAAGLAEVPVLVNTTVLPVRVTALPPDSVVLSLSGLDVRLRVDGTGAVLGGVIPAQGLRLERVADARLGPPPRPDYSAPAGAPYSAEPVTVKGPAGPLAGTLTLPAGRRGRVPAVVTITGSGLQERDESLGLMVPGFRPFRQVADTLGRRGIAVLRLDDRGYGESGGDVAHATTEDFARDIEAAVAYLRGRPEIDPARIGLVGHSEGGIIAPMVAAADPRIRAIALMAGTAFTGRRVLDYQFRYALQRDGTPAGPRLDSAAAQAYRAFTQPGNAWTRFFVDYDPLPTARRVRAPVLILQGAVDRQVTADQAQVLADAFRAGGDADVTVRVFPERNHLFLRDSTGDPRNYSRLADYRIDGEVLGALADWLAARLGI